jgi:tetratricopeptide (TPR) repeat protein
VPTRTIPSVSAISLKASHSHREKGNEHFKRGDYSSAHQAYTTAISHLPSTHPIIIVLLTNRALTALKIGEPKTAVTDSDAALSIIGISKGESEHIDFSNAEPPKPMRDYFGKALMRKAEALEQMEKWSDAAAIWREAVEAGHGGATSIQGRLRAEKAAKPQPSKPKPKPPVPKKPPPRRSALDDLSLSHSPSTAQDSAAVSALRAANAALEKADDEKFALSDSVDARLNAWKNGKQDNLRALLGSLDTALWEGSGWKKISMADLVLPGRVKVQYMKGIGKVHPDKVSLTSFLFVLVLGREGEANEGNRFRRMRRPSRG